jgi:uncharacterized protein
VRVTADTNIYISALLFKGQPLQLLELAQTGRASLYISRPIMDEILRVLREKFALPEDDVSEAEETMRPRPVMSCRP